MIDTDGWTRVERLLFVLVDLEILPLILEKKQVKFLGRKNNWRFAIVYQCFKKQQPDQDDADPI